MKILVFYGTRPEFLKLYPVIKELINKGFDITSINTGQHKELVLELEGFFNYKADIYWEIMKVDQNLNDIVSSIVTKTEILIKEINPNLIIVEGDTSTVLSAALAAFHNKVKIAHVEAGLRSFNINSPYPEEFNRRTVSLIADYNFAPTQKAADNLIKEGVPKDKVFITGNTIIDTLGYIKNKLRAVNVNPKKILITAHRRENHGEGIKKICEAVKQLIKKDDSLEFIWPLHPNPNVKPIVLSELNTYKNVKLIDPLDYLSLINEINNSYIIWTDSGGIQEEVSELKKPVLILRSETERPEVIVAGFGILVGTNIELIIKESTKLLNDTNYYNSKIKGKNPFGDGKASKKICKILLNRKF